MTWRDRANEVIAEAVKDAEIEWLAQDRPLETLDRDAMFRHISREYYPFGPREHWPYKAWLSAIRNWRRFGQGSAPRPVVDKPPAFVDPAQTDLFTTEGA